MLIKTKRYIPVMLGPSQICERVHNHQAKYFQVYSRDIQFHLNEDDQDQARFRQHKIWLWILEQSKNKQIIIHFCHLQFHVRYKTLIGPTNQLPIVFYTCESRLSAHIVNMKLQVTTSHNCEHKAERVFCFKRVRQIHHKPKINIALKLTFNNTTYSFLQEIDMGGGGGKSQNHLPFLTCYLRTLN